MDKLERTITIAETHAGQRLDQVLSKLMPEHSRSRIQGWIKAGMITMNDKQARPRDPVEVGSIVKLDVSFSIVSENEPEAMPLDIVHEDDAIILINKPANLVVHPGAGNPTHTLVNALLHHDNKLNQVPRAGIVHRLDKDTTGIMLVARTPQAHTYLVDKLQAREIKREYQALVCGTITAGGSIETDIGRHPTRRTRMAVVNSGKHAVTHYRLLEKFEHYTLLRVMLETGRTHQIRVHMAHIKHPVVGDPVYGKNKSILKGVTEPVREAISGFKRQALHAWQLQLPHPASGEPVTYSAPLPTDLQALVSLLSEHDR